MSIDHTQHNLRVSLIDINLYKVPSSETPKSISDIAKYMYLISNNLVFARALNDLFG